MFSTPSVAICSLLATFAFSLVGSVCAVADGPKDNNPLDVRPVPPTGIEVPAGLKQRLLSQADSIDARISAIPNLDPVSRGLLSVFPRAARMTFATNMIYHERELSQIDALLKQAASRTERAEQGQRGVSLLGIADSSAEKTQRLVGGLISDIDGSVQPFGIELPAGFSADHDSPLRLDVWLHGRGERVSECAFLHQRQTRGSQFTPANTVVLHPYGRYSNAFKFAGEIDVLEAIACVQKLLPIDEDRICIRGFSMGGAGCWQMAVHYPGLFAAANPGAGFSETMQFLDVFQGEKFVPTAYQSKMLNWYDCPPWTNNLRNLPTVAYSGELDRQKQAADVMAAAFAERGMKLQHEIGPQTEHKIAESSKPIIQSALDQYLDRGLDRIPQHVDLTTYTLRYNRLHWLEIEALESHWSAARVQGKFTNESFVLETSGVTSLRLTLPDGSFPADKTSCAVVIDGSTLNFPLASSRSLDVYLARNMDGQWESSEPDSELRKRHGLQGPIDDAFMGPFLFVSPDTTEPDPALAAWLEDEQQHAHHEWIRQFRGDVRKKSADKITSQDALNHNLILFGSPRSNSYLRKIIDQLPIQWDETSITFGGTTSDAAGKAVLMVYPNPLNPNRYVVLNSGFTYREYAYLNNARQIPMLPDWAIVDVSKGSTTQFPGDVIEAGFFDERWNAPTLSK